jgi:hypothetical protein
MLERLLAVTVLQKKFHSHVAGGFIVNAASINTIICHRCTPDLCLDLESVTEELLSGLHVLLNRKYLHLNKGSAYWSIVLA